MYDVHFVYTLMALLICLFLRSLYPLVLFFKDCSWVVYEGSDLMSGICFKMIWYLGIWSSTDERRLAKCCYCWSCMMGTWGLSRYAPCACVYLKMTQRKKRINRKTGFVNTSIRLEFAFETGIYIVAEVAKRLYIIWLYMHKNVCLPLPIWKLDTWK